MLSEEGRSRHEGLPWRRRRNARVWEVGWGNVPLFFLRCFGAEVPSYFAGRGSLGAFPWFVPLTLWWVHCNTHSFMMRVMRPCAIEGLNIKEPWGVTLFQWHE
jgi:hypothetical protein